MSPTEIKTNRNRLRISQLELSRRAKVSRWKINNFELGDGTLSTEELNRIVRVFADELREVNSLQIA